jgi:membrane-bound metal-dependent hydrolase YbcI (DUF457 family)
MPSTLVHVGLAALLGTALLGERFEVRALAVVMVAGAVPDLDTFVGLWLMDGGHRTLFHTLMFPALVLAVLGWDSWWRERSWLRTHWGDVGVRAAWVSVVGGWVISQILLDAFFNGANLLWPLHDQFIDLSGYVAVTDQRGLVQTMFGLEWTADGARIAPEHRRGGRRETHYYTGVNPGDAADPGVERIFPIAENGPLFLVMVAGYLAAAIRVWESR